MKGEVETNLAIVIIATLISYSLSSCPKPKELPKSISGWPLCARLYDNTHTDIRRACQGSYYDVPHGTFMPKMGRWKHRMSAVVVKKGCAIKLYSRPNYGGNSRTLESGRHHDLRQYRRSFWVWKHWSDATASYQCYCW